jgi:L-alanine-DL-glutamate epimerase-like enolase superfamily enzyme
LPMTLGRSWASPAAAWIDLTQRMRRNAIQSGEPGPFAACIAGIEVALSDLAARKASLPLWKCSADRRSPASDGVCQQSQPQGCAATAACRQRGYRAKLKVAST